MNIALWILQGVLAAMFLMAGGMKTVSPIQELAAQMPWAADVPSWVVRMSGVSEMLGAVGLVLPAALRIKPMLTPIAGAALSVVMLLAAVLHLSRGEYGMMIPPLVLFAMVEFVAYGRWKLAPIEPK